MSKTLLIYERALPVNKDRHRKWGVNVGNDFHFAKDVNSMPLLAQEFRDAAREYPIVFAGTAEQVMPAVLLGFGVHENLFVDDAGQWQAKYIPAFARRYPYVFSSNDDGKALTLCIDEEFSGISQDGEGKRLFTDDGEYTDYLNEVLKFQQDFQQFFQRTRTFCKRIQELDLLAPMRAELKLSGGEQKTIAGFMVVRRDRVKELSGEQLSKLAVVDELELIYLHLQSLQNVTDVARRFKPDAISTTGDSSSGSAEEKAAAGDNEDVDTTEKQSSARQEAR